MDELSFRKLRREHDEIEMLARRLAAQLDDARVPAMTLAALLRDLVTLVREHLAEESARIYEVAARAVPGLATETVERAEREFELLRTNWQDYLRLWDERSIVADRAGFVAASRAMLPRLRDRVRLENELLMAMAIVRSAPQSPAA